MRGVSQTLRDTWWCVSIWTGVLIAGLTLSNVGRGAEAGEFKHIQVWMQQQDCSVYRAVLGKTKTKVIELRKIQADVEQLEKETRKGLEKCGTDNGLEVDTEEEELILADYCVDEYAGWMAVKNRLSSLRAEEKEELNGYQNLGWIVESRCQGLKMAKNP